jgi:sulfite reductase (NADPH) flavoprotein alpha-component
MKSNLYSRQNPFYGSVKSRCRLNKIEGPRQTWHVEIDLHDSGIAYEPGDSVAILPYNDQAKVKKILQHLNATGKELIDGMPLSQFLQLKVNIATPTKRLLDALKSPFSQDEKIEFDVEEALQMHEKISYEQFVTLLSPLLPRFYSIASSQHRARNGVDLLVAYVNYKVEDKERKGVCSHFLCDQVEIGEKTVGLYLHPTKDFRLPASASTPIIMVGPGTGVAPYRAFLQQRLFEGAKQNWLFFGECHRYSDFFYEEFWNECVANGFLTLDTAFSRDQKEKVYVQHILWQKRQELWRWLQEGASFYVCGDAHHMAKDVDATLHKIAESEGSLSIEEAKSYMKQLRLSKRYLRDVY